MDEGRIIFSCCFTIIIQYHKGQESFLRYLMDELQRNKCDERSLASGLGGILGRFISYIMAST